MPQRSRVNQYPDPAAARRSRRREQERDKGHVNPAYARHSSDSSSIGSDVEGRDLSPPRIRHQFSSLSSDDSSSVDDDVIPGNDSFKMERETNSKNSRASYKRSRHNDMLDSDRSDSSQFRRNNDATGRRSRRDDYKPRNPRSDSPLTIGSLKKHEAITGSDNKEDTRSSRHNRSRRREQSPSRTNESSEYTLASLTTEGTVTTASSSRFQKNPSLRRNSPSRSSSHRRYRNDHEKDSTGRRKPRRTRSHDRGDRTDSRSDRSKSSDGGSQRSSSSRSSSRRSRSAAKAEAKQVNKDQAMLPIFANNKKSSAV